VVKLCGASVSCGDGDVCVAQERVGEAREPHVVGDGDQLFAFVEIRDGDALDRCAIYRARVVTPRRWIVDPPTPVLEPSEEGGCLGSPSVIVDEAGLSLYAARGDGSGIVRAWSNDGLDFRRTEQPVLVPSEAWERGWVGAVGVVSWQGATLLLYEGGPGEGVGWATFDGSGTATRRQSGPWLSPPDFEDPVLWRHVQRVGSPFPLVHDGALLVYLTVRGMEGSDATISEGSYPADPNDSIGLVAVRGDAPPEIFASGPVFARRTNLRAYLGESEPAVVLQRNESWLVFSAADASGQRRTGLGLAVSRR